MQRSEIRSEARRLLHDTNSIQFTDAILNDWVDLWNIEVNTRLELDTAVSTVTTVQGEPNYNLGSIYIFLTEIYLVDSSGTENRLQVVSQDELNDIFGRDWRSDAQGQPSVGYLADYNVLGLHPSPDASNAGRTLRVFGKRDTADLASDTDVPISIRAIHTSGPWYVASLGYGFLGDTNKSEYCKRRFEEILNLHKHRQWKQADDLLSWRWQ